MTLRHCKSKVYRHVGRRIGAPYAAVDHDEVLVILNIHHARRHDPPQCTPVVALVVMIQQSRIPWQDHLLKVHHLHGTPTVSDLSQQPNAALDIIAILIDPQPSFVATALAMMATVPLQGRSSAWCTPAEAIHSGSEREHEFATYCGHGSLFSALVEAGAPRRMPCAPMQYAWHCTCA